MSRRIASYPYNEYYKDTIEFDANTVEMFELKTTIAKAYNIVDKSVNTIHLRVSARAEEEREGVFMKLRNEDVDPPVESDELVFDEKEFCEAIYQAILSGELAEDSPFILDCISKCFDNYAINNVKGALLEGIQYHGFGVILSGDAPIATIDSVTITSVKSDNKRVPARGQISMVLSPCVGLVDLNNVDDCSIQFVSDSGIKFTLTEFKMSSSEAVDDYVCEYRLTDFAGTWEANLENPEFSEYSKDNEDWFNERIAYIDGAQEDQREDIFSDLL